NSAPPVTNPVSPPCFAAPHHPARTFNIPRRKPKTQQRRQGGLAASRVGRSLSQPAQPAIERGRRSSEGPERRSETAGVAAGSGGCEQPRWPLTPIAFSPAHAPRRPRLARGEISAIQREGACASLASGRLDLDPQGRPLGEGVG